MPDATSPTPATLALEADGHFRRNLLESVPYSKLNFAASQRTGDDSKRGTIVRRHGIQEIWMVEHVEELRAKFEVIPLPELEILR